MPIVNNKKWSFRLLQTKDRKRPDGRFPVAIVLNLNGRKIITQDDLTALPSEWNKDAERFVEKSKQRSSILIANNIYLDSLSTKINSIIADHRERRVFLSNEMLVEKMNFKTQSATVEGYTNNYIKNLYEIKKIGRAKVLEAMLTYFKQFDKKFSERVFQEITYSYIVSFVQFQADITRKGGAQKKGGISVHLRALRRILNEAITDGVGSPETYPFSTKYSLNQKVYSIVTELKTKTRKRYIPDVMLREFLNYKFKSKAHQRSQAIFFLSFFGGGINFADMAKLKKTDLLTGYNTCGECFQYIIFYRSKTNEPIEVVLNPDIRNQIDFLTNNYETVEDYLLPIVTTPSLDAEALYNHIAEKRKKLNKYLKKMAEIMNFPETFVKHISTYYARHSFAMKMLSKTDNIYLVSQSLHHKDIDTTMIYLEDYKADQIAAETSNLLN